MDNIAYVDRPLLFLNLFLLLWVVAIPFATGTMADYLVENDQDARIAMALYALVAFAVAFISPQAALALIGLVAVYYVFERTPAAPGRNPQSPM